MKTSIVILNWNGADMMPESPSAPSALTWSARAAFAENDFALAIQTVTKLADGPRKSRDKAADGKSDGYGGLKDDKYDDCKYAAAEGSAKLLVNRLAAKLAYKNGGESPEKRRKKSNKEFHTHPPLKIKVRKQNVMTTVNAVKYSPAFSF